MEVYNKIPDAQLTALIKADDHIAFTEIYDRYNALLYIHADNKLRNSNEARDVVQDVFVRLWEKRAELNITTNLSGYLYTAVRNQIFNLIKHKKVISSYTESFYVSGSESEVFADHLIREKQFEAMIKAEIAALPPRMRQVFELRRLENLSNKEVASRLNITESTAADQMKKAIKALKVRIGLILILASFVIK